MVKSDQNNILMQIQATNGWSRKNLTPISCDSIWDFKFSLNVRRPSIFEHFLTF